MFHSSLDRDETHNTSASRLKSVSHSYLLQNFFICLWRQTFLYRFLYFHILLCTNAKQVRVLVMTNAEKEKSIFINFLRGGGGLCLVHLPLYYCYIYLLVVATLNHSPPGPDLKKVAKVKTLRFQSQEDLFDELY